MTEFPVRASARAVASGVLVARRDSREGQEGEPEPHLKVTVSFRPMAIEAGADATGAIPFAAWPSSVAGLLREHAMVLDLLTLAPIGAGDKLPVPDAVMQRSEQPLTSWARRPEPDDDDHIDRLWQHALPLNEREPFTELYKQLRAYGRLFGEEATKPDPLQPACVLPNVAGQIAVASQLERALVQLRALEGDEGWELDLVGAAVRVARDHLDEVAKVAALPPIETDQQKPTNSLALADYRLKVASALVGDEIEKACAKAMRQGARVAGAEGAQACLDGMREGARGGNRLPGLVLTPFRDVLKELVHLSLLNTVATAMGQDEHKALEDALKVTRTGEQEKPYQPPAPVTEKPNDANDVGLISRRLQELQEISELGRLFNMILDFEVDLAAWADQIVNAGSRDPFGRLAGYGYIRVRWPKRDLPGDFLADDASRWTLAKLTLGGDGAPLSFLPCTSEEALAALSPGGCADDREHLTIVDGVRLLSARPDGNPRHELNSIDPMDAAQDLESRLSLLMAHVSAQAGRPAKQVARAFLATRPAGEPWPTASLKSRSLRLIHPHEGSRLGQALGRAAHLGEVAAKDLVLDAEDLSLGWLVDAAGRPPGCTEPREWHALSAARVTYLDPREDGIENLDGLIRGFFRDDAERRRHQRSTAALLNLVKRDGTRILAVADELLFQYDGDQMGADPRAGGNEGGRTPGVVIDRRGLLDVGRRYGSIEELDDREKPCPLVFGIGYYLAAREVFVGGGSASDDLCSGPGGLFEEIGAATVPRLAAGCEDSAEPAPGHRLVRAEPIARPLVLLNGLRPANREGRYARDYEPSTTRDVVLRSAWSDERQAYRAIDNEGTEEIVVVPGSVDLELAHRHGAFRLVDMVEREGVVRPRDGLWGIDMSRPGGGWATLDHVYVTPEADPVLLRREINGAPQRGEGGRAASNALFRAGGGRQPWRERPYYPDPMHQATGFRFRRAGTRAGWIGTACIVPTPEGAFPDIPPVAVSIRRAALGAPLRMRHLKDSPVAVANTNLACENLRIEVPPGVAVELVIWPIPRLGDLARCSEVVSLRATLGVALRGRRGKARAAAERLAELKGLGRMVGEGELFAPDPACEVCGVAGCTAPTPAQLTTVARRVMAALREGPVDIVCAHESIAIAHAVDRPIVAPRAVAPAEPPPSPAPQAHPAIFARRATPAPPSLPLLGLIPEPQRIDPGFFAGEGEPGLSLNGRGTDVDLAGFVEIDPMSTEAVEVLAEAAFEARIDDPDRRRSAQHVRRGSSPTDPEVRGAPMNARKVYGFDVHPDGTVLAPRVRFRLARFAGIPALATGDLEAAKTDIAVGWTPPRAVLALHRLFDLASNADRAERGNAAPPTRPSPEGIRVDVEAALVFPQARNLTLTFRAVSRFRRQMTKRARTTVWSPGDAPGTPAIPPAAETLRHDGPEVVLPLPASKRPAAPLQSDKMDLVLLPDKVTLDSPGLVRRERRTRVRLSFRRPGFTSGDREWIGIVLSPRPSTFGRDARYAREHDALRPDAQGPYRLRNRFPNPQYLPADLAGRLTQFADKGFRPARRPHADDLESRPYGLFPVPLPLFADAKFDRWGRFLEAEPGVDFVAGAQLPFYPDRAPPGEGGVRIEPTEPLPPQGYFPVDLLLYEPRFDLGREHWYVDITLDPRHTLDPHLQLGVVRYQPFAPRDLRVSRIGDPVRVLLLPRRAVEVERPIGQPHAVVSVEGPAGPPEEMPTSGPVLASEQGPRTRMSARLVGYGTGARARVRLRDERVPLAPSSDGAAWSGKLRLNPQPGQDERIVVSVEETEVRAAATPKVEPAYGVDSLVPQEGGIRYIVQLPLPEEPTDLG